MIGYYAHSHGNGHSNYAQVLADALGDDLIVFTDSDYAFASTTNVIRLDDEEFYKDELKIPGCERPVFLHYNPLGLRNIQRRSSTILAEVVKNNIRLMLVDVSVEIATLCRVSSVPYAYRRMPGDRNDLPHLEAYRGAVFLFAYYPKQLEHRDTPQWIIEKTIYLGFISRLAHSNKHLGDNPSSLLDIKNILVVQGSGGNSFSDVKLTSIIAQFPNRKINTIGHFDFTKNYKNHNHYGFVSDIAAYVKVADVIIAACGSSVTSELLSYHRKFVAIAEKRPFLEQDHILSFLEKQELAVALKGVDFQSAIKTLLQLDKEIAPSFLPRSIDNFRPALRNFYSKLEAYS